jgi:hypothetical protein
MYVPSNRYWGSLVAELLRLLTSELNTTDVVSRPISTSRAKVFRHALVTEGVTV